ncbi:MAG: hypothetical protein K0Q46_5971 [Rhodococcus erythropolis]|nr:hypothetical protein [Rhodococcus erythropolis]
MRPAPNTLRAFLVGQPTVYHLVREPFRVRLDHRSSQAAAAAVALDVMGEALVLVPAVFSGAGYHDKACERSCFDHGDAFPRISSVLDYSPLHGTDLRSRTCGGIVSRSDE